MIDTLPPDALDGLRLAYADSTPQLISTDEEVNDFLASCADHALRQVAEAGIRSLSFYAIVAGWKRGVKVFRKNPTHEK